MTLRSERVRVRTWLLKRYDAAFSAALVTATSTWTTRSGYFLAAIDQDGRIGLGEAAPLQAWGTESLEAANQALQALRPLEVNDINDVPGALALAGLNVHLTPAAHAAAELALLDLLAQRAGLSLATLLADGGRVAERVSVSALIGASSPEAAAEEARSYQLAGYRTIKLKLNGHLVNDLARVAAVRAAIGKQVELRLDVNGAWTPAEAAESLAALAPYRLAYVEQPLPATDLAGLAKLTSGSIPIAADETVHLPGGLAAALAAGAAVVVLKPMVLGGLLATKIAVERTEAAGARFVLSSALDRGVATAGAVHLAATRPDALAAGLATATAFEVGPALAGLVPLQGAIEVPTSPGLGFPVRAVDLQTWLAAAPC